MGTSRIHCPAHPLTAGDLQQSDIEDREYQQIQGHDPDPKHLLQLPEYHGHQRAADIGGCHLKADNCGTEASAEIGRIMSIRNRIVIA